MDRGWSFSSHDEERGRFILSTTEKVYTKDELVGVLQDILSEACQRFVAVPQYHDRAVSVDVWKENDNLYVEDNHIYGAVRIWRSPGDTPVYFIQNTRHYHALHLFTAVIGRLINELVSGRF